MRSIQPAGFWPRAILFAIGSFAFVSCHSSTQDALLTDSGRLTASGGGANGEGYPGDVLLAGYYVDLSPGYSCAGQVLGYSAYVDTTIPGRYVYYADSCQPTSGQVLNPQNYWISRIDGDYVAFQGRIFEYIGTQLAPQTPAADQAYKNEAWCSNGPPLTASNDTGVGAAWEIAIRYYATTGQRAAMVFLNPTIYYTTPISAYGPIPVTRQEEIVAFNPPALSYVYTSNTQPLPPLQGPGSFSMSVEESPFDTADLIYYGLMDTQNSAGDMLENDGMFCVWAGN